VSAKPKHEPHERQPRKTALITGVTGQDGSYLAELLLEKGYEVVGVVRRTSHDSYERIGHLLDRLHVVAADLLDQHSLTSVIRDAKPAEVYNNLGYVYADAGRVNEAIAAYHEAIRLKPNYPEAQVELAYASVKLGETAPANSSEAKQKFANAVAAYKEAIRLKPDYASAYSGLGDLYRHNLHQYEEAIEAYKQAQRLKQPVPPSEAKLAFTVKLPHSLIQRVRTFAAAKRLSISEVVSRALLALLPRGRGRG